MDFQSFKVRYLESLSTGELVELADRNGLDIPPDLERVFIIGELLELERYGRRDEDGEGKEVAAGELAGLAKLPERYCVSYIDVLVRDPLWVFAFWEARAQDEGPDAGERFLRVLPLRGGDFLADASAALTVGVGAGDGSLYVGIPYDMGRHFRIDLCAWQNGGGAVLASSRPFTLPRLAGQQNGGLSPPDENGDARAGPLSELSGASRFRLVRNTDRLSRRKDA